MSLDKETFMKEAVSGFISIDEFSSYKLIKVNQTEVSSMPDKLLKQLKKEDLYDKSYVGIVVLSGMEGFPVEATSLPIYGTKKKYDISCLKKTKEDAILADLETMQFNLTN